MRQRMLQSLETEYNWRPSTESIFWISWQAFFSIFRNCCPHNHDIGVPKGDPTPLPPSTALKPGQRHWPTAPSRPRDPSPAMSTVSGSDSVFGHYIQQAASWEPLLSESSALFRAVVEDDAAHVEAEIGADAARVNAFYVLLHWGSQPQGGAGGKEEAPGGDGSMKPAVTVKQRTLLMIAAFHGSMRVLSLLAVNGADPAVVSPDGMTSYELAYAGNHPSTPTIVAYLRDAESSLQVLRGQVDVSKAPLAQLPPSGSFGMEGVPQGERVDAQQEHYRGQVWGMPIARQDSGSDPYNPDALPYSTSELTKPEYSTDEFRMYCFKVLRCCRRYAHDWRACPFAHPTENARRRDPRDYRYCSIACPNYKQGFCMRGDGCPYAHGVFECWLHPSRYRSQLCKDGNKCRRPVCFFAHSLPELRTPSHTWVPTAEDAVSRPDRGGAPSNSIPQGSQASGMHSAPVPQPQASAPVDPAISADINLPPIVVPSPIMVPAPVVVPMQPQATAAMVQPMSPPAATPVTSVPSPHAPNTPGAAVGNGSQQAAEGGPGVTAPRMSNAFARKLGLNPKDSPMVNLQKMAIAGQIPPGPAHAGKQPAQGQVLPVLPPETAAPMMKGANRQRKLLKQASQAATLEALARSMSGMTLSPSSSQGPGGENHGADGLGNAHGFYPNGPLPIAPIAIQPVAPSSPAVPHMGTGQYMCNGYMVGSPAGPGGYVPMVAGSQPGASLGMAGQAGPISLHPTQ
ncbi:unnamed protein product [Ostreobium quekettii]|uniref:C3H1-type domain-containing protein n=1 Tax=Ostreobium quekettii TaxID=121088 RepID=A0A8S1IZ87_9CHLO|nr:unnamed protein product [Ostreobium quekettii]|eukprot:evm.model.scf_592.7 EVM.evm.TU.scf_592.7   scf_592:32776-37702(+)